MSELDDIQQDTEAPDRGLIHREYQANATVGDGRTVDVRIVPYGEKITHDDGLGGAARGVPYTEEWAPGSFKHQLSAANRVLANFEHQEGIAGIIGRGKTLVERADGLYGTFSVLPTPTGDTALELIREGVTDGVSLEAVPRKAVRTATGVKRTKADLLAVAFTRFAAYAGAVVLAVREQAIFDEDLLPIEPDPELLERCRALGVRLPQRYQAPPDEPPDPSADADTPGDAGTRPSIDNTGNVEVQA